jgi:hypothetical protein
VPLVADRTSTRPRSVSCEASAITIRSLIGSKAAAVISIGRRIDLGVALGETRQDSILRPSHLEKGLAHGLRYLRHEFLGLIDDDQHRNAPPP